MNKKGTTDDMDWDVMRREEVHDQQNDYEKLDICTIYILSCYWKSTTGNMMLRITGLNGLSEDVAEADDGNIDYPYTFSL